MIQMTDVVKVFGEYAALNHLECTIERETIYGVGRAKRFREIHHAAADRGYLPGRIRHGMY